MNNTRFVLDGKHQIFPVSEDCLVLNIYSPAEATTGAGRPVRSPEGSVHPASSTWPAPPPRPCSKTALRVPGTP